MARIASNEECLEFVGNNRKLQAVCNIGGSGQFLFPRETFDPEIYVDESNNIIEDFKYSIQSDCSTMTADDCQTIIWTED
jgi:hypothetical protein